MQYVYTTEGTCSKQIIVDIDHETNNITDIHFVGGCPGNTIGVATLCKGKNVDEVISKLEGIKCGAKSTSCPDQLARALKAIQQK
jgi:uncharacterized protein (TIGR03905 family)